MTGLPDNSLSLPTSTRREEAVLLLLWKYFLNDKLQGIVKKSVIQIFHLRYNNTA